MTKHTLWSKYANRLCTDSMEEGAVKKDPLLSEIPQVLVWRRKWQPTPVLLPGKSHGRSSLVGCSPWGREESDTTERLHFHFSLSCTGEGNGNPLQCSCLENPRDWGAWWAAVYGVAQSRTWLKRLSSSRSSKSLSSALHSSPKMCLSVLLLLHSHCQLLKGCDSSRPMTFFHSSFISSLRKSSVTP